MGRPIFTNNAWSICPKIVFLVYLLQAIGGCYKNTTSKCVKANEKPVMILTWNLDQELNLTIETSTHKKHGWWCHVDISDLLLIGGMYGFSMDASIKLTFSFTVTFYLIKIENRTKESLTQLLHYCFWEGSIFVQKKWQTCSKKSWLAKLMGSWY